MIEKKEYIISLDQGTTSSRACVFDQNAHLVEVVQKEFPQYYPHPSWVEHDPMEIYASQYSVMVEAITICGINPKQIKALGITNQRETTIIWDRATGKPIYNAICWQCRRTADLVEKIKAEGMEEYILQNTGLIPDAYFSATKIKWILDHVPGSYERAKKGELCFGTVDTWLIYRLTEGKEFVTDFTNASRTMLFNIHSLKWDDKLLEYFNIPKEILPEVKPSSSIFGNVNLFGCEIPIAGVAGDQQSALFGQTCFQKGDAKNTYGTGCFLLMNTGSEIYHSKNGLITTIAASLENEPIQYALEGSVFVGGALVQWLRDEMKFISKASQSEEVAYSVKDNGGVFIVPAFTGLGAPYWDMYARGSIFGLTRGSNQAHIVRASLEAIAFQTLDVINAMQKDTNIHLNSLKVDGGASKNNFLMQFQADISDVEVTRGKVMETTALGVFFLAGLKVKMFENLEQIKNLIKKEKVYLPSLEEEKRNKYLIKWHQAVKMARDWSKE